jgi:hypothetical protein
VKLASDGIEFADWGLRLGGFGIQGRSGGWARGRVDMRGDGEVLRTGAGSGIAGC